MSDTQYVLNHPADNAALNALLARAWAGHTDRDFPDSLERSLAYVCAYSEGRLVGFVNVAWDGDSHAFLLDPTVDPDFQRRGVGRELVRRAADAARESGAEWLHVDYEPHLDAFYKGAGFRSTAGGADEAPRRGRGLTGGRGRHAPVSHGLDSRTARHRARGGEPREIRGERQGAG